MNYINLRKYYSETLGQSALSVIHLENGVRTEFLNTRIPVEDRPVYLRLYVQGRQSWFEWSYDGEKYEKIGCSASGETPMLVEHAAKAKKVGAAIMLITTSEASSLAVLSDSMITIDASSKTTRSDASVQPMGSLFEQSTAILLDIIVLCLMEKHGISSDDMYRNHSNLE